MDIFLLVGFIFFVGGFMRAAIGFGDSLIAMSVLPFFLSVKTTTPLVALSATTIGITVLARIWKQVDFLAVWRLIFSSVLGIPVGLYGLKAIPEAWVKLGLGCLLIVFGTYNLLQAVGPRIHSERWSYVAGFLAGVLGGAYNINGPPVVIYGAMSRWTPERFVATLQGYFLPTGIFIIIGHGLSGLWTTQVFHLYGIAFPMIFFGVWLGRHINQRLKPGTFDKLIYGFLVIAGTAMAFS